MERIREEKLPKAFLESYIKWHTRKHQLHIKSWCSCNFCIEKWAGTRYIGHTPFMSLWNEHIKELRAVPCHNLDYEDTVKYLIKKERERKRKIVRAKLKEMEEEIL